MGEARAKSTSSLSWASIFAAIAFEILLAGEAVAEAGARSKRSIGSFGFHSSNCSLGT